MSAHPASRPSSPLHLTKPSTPRQSLNMFSWIASTLQYWLMFGLSPFRTAAPVCPHLQPAGTSGTAAVQCLPLPPPTPTGNSRTTWLGLATLQSCLNALLLLVFWCSPLPVPYYTPLHSARAGARRYPARPRSLPDRFCSCQSLERPACGCDLTTD